MCKKGAMIRYRSIVSATRLEKYIYQGVPGKRNDGKGKGLQPPDVGYCLQHTKRDWKKVKRRIEHISLGILTRSRSWGVADRRFDSLALL